MTIKILGGEARGFQLSVPNDQTYLRPTSIILRRKIFDWRQHWIDWSFIDLCAGTGAMGIEALSRGALQVDFVEKNKTYMKCVELNLLKLSERYPDFKNQIKTYSVGFEKYLKEQNWKSHNSQDPAKMVLFFDPPYEDGDSYRSFIELVKKYPFPGEIWIESDELKGTKSAILKTSFSSIFKEVTQGSHFILMGKLT